LRQLQRSFEPAAGTFSRDSGVRRRGLATRTVNCFRGDVRWLGCTHPRKCGWQRRGRTGVSQALPLAVFSRPGCSLCWITIRRTFARSDKNVRHLGCSFCPPELSYRAGFRAPSLRSALHLKEGVRPRGVNLPGPIAILVNGYSLFRITAPCLRDCWEPRASLAQIPQ
jgi:hypothetical protein